MTSKTISPFMGEMNSVPPYMEESGKKWGKRWRWGKKWSRIGEKWGKKWRKKWRWGWVGDALSYNYYLVLTKTSVFLLIIKG